MLKQALLALPVVVLASGCASIIRGTSQDFSVQSTPPGAQATLSTGETCVTPCTLRRTRKEPFSVTVALDGYQPSTHAISNPWSRNGTTTGIVGNAILGGGIGIGIDAATGANRDLTPNPLIVTLEAIPAPPALVAEASTEAVAPSAEAAAPESASAEISALGPPAEISAPAEETAATTP